MTPNVQFGQPPFLYAFKRVRGAGDEKWRADCPLCGRRERISVYPVDEKGRWHVSCYGDRCDFRDVLRAAGVEEDHTYFSAERRTQLYKDKDKTTRRGEPDTHQPE